MKKQNTFKTSNEEQSKDSVAGLSALIVVVIVIFALAIILGA